MARSRPDPARRAARERGIEAETRVGALLERNGWQCLARNWRGGGGEIDLIVQRGERVRFVEVKARRNGDPTALESITWSKRRKLIGAANAWMGQHDLGYRECCFLVAIVACDDEDSSMNIELYDDPFDGS